MRKHSLSALIIAGILALPLLSMGESLFDLEKRWLELQVESFELDREGRVASARAFFETVDWESIASYCVENADAGPDMSSFLSGLVDGKLRNLDWRASEVVPIIGDPDMNSSCQSAIIKHIYTVRDSLRDTSDASALAHAFLDLADSGTRSIPHSRQLEKGAAYLWSGDSMRDRMMRYCRSDDLKLVKHGVDMLCESADEAAKDSLFVVTKRIMDSDQSIKALSKALTGLSECCGSARFDYFLELLTGRNLDFELRKLVLHAVGRSQDTRAYKALLDEYTYVETDGIVDATYAIEDRERHRFFHALWFSTRLAEPGIMDELARDGADSELAIDLLDRASRFGLLDSREKIDTAMLVWAESRGGDWPARIQEIVDRLALYPDPRAR